MKELDQMKVLRESMSRIEEGDDKTVDDVKQNHPEIYEFFKQIGAWMSFDHYGKVQAYNTAGNHMVQIQLKPSAGLSNTKANLDAAGIQYDVINDKWAGEMVNGTFGDIHFTVKDDNKPGNITETWLFALPHADDEIATYHDRTMEGVDEGEDTQTKFRDTFSAVGLPVYDVQVEEYDDNWIKVKCKGHKQFRAGTQEKIQFVAECYWSVDSDEVSGMARSQKSHYDKTYSQTLDTEEEELTLAEFAEKVNAFVTHFADTTAAAYSKGEQEYWSKGGRGMMPGAVHRK